MAFLPISGKIQCQSYPKTASTAFAVGQAVILTSGQLVSATTTSTFQAGVAMRKVTSADADYASATPMSVWSLQPDTEFLIDVITGTATAALVGTYVDIASGGMGVDVGTSTIDQVLVTGYVSPTQIIGKFNSADTFFNA